MAVTRKAAEVKVNGASATMAFTAINVSVGDLIVVFVQPSSTVATLSCSDTIGNSYTAVSAATDGTAMVYAFYTISTGSNASNVVTLTNSSSVVLYIGGLAQYAKPFSGFTVGPDIGAAPGFGVSPATTTLTTTSSRSLTVVFGTGFYAGGISGPNLGETVSFASPFTNVTSSAGSFNTPATNISEYDTSAILSSQSVSFSSSLGNGQNTRLVFKGLTFYYSIAIKMYSNGAFQAAQFIEGGL